MVSAIWAWTLSWSVFDIPSVVPLNKTDFSSSSTYQLQIAFWLEVRLVLTSSALYWCFVWPECVQILCMLSQPLWIHMCSCLVLFMLLEKKSNHKSPRAVNPMLCNNDLLARCAHLFSHFFRKLVLRLPSWDGTIPIIINEARNLRLDRSLA